MVAVVVLLVATLLPPLAFFLLDGSSVSADISSFARRFVLAVSDMVSLPSFERRRRSVRAEKQFSSRRRAPYWKTSLPLTGSFEGDQSFSHRTRFRPPAKPYLIDCL